MSRILGVSPIVKERSLWVYYFALVLTLSTLCFGDLRFHQLNTHDADSFADHLRIEQDGSYFFSSNKAQAQGRLFADAVKYAAFLAFGNAPAAFHLLVVAVHVLASLLLALLVRYMGYSVEWTFASGLFFLLNVAHFEAVHWISALDYPLGLACACAAFLCLETQVRMRLGWFSLLMILAVQSHPSLAALWFLPLYRLMRAGADRALLYRFALTAVPILVAIATVIFFASPTASTWQSVDEYAIHSAPALILGQVRIFLFLSSRLFSTAHWLLLPIYSQDPWELGLGLIVLGTLLYLVYRRQAPFDWAALWILVSLVPYVLLTAATIDDLPAGPSRYLYVASAGSSLLLAAGWQYIYRRQRYIGVALLLAVVVSSCVNLRKVEAISHYTAARSYSARLELDNALEQYERALATAADVLPLEDFYPRYIIMLMGGTRDFLPVLETARSDFPANPDIELCELSVRATAEDSTVRVQAMRQIEQKAQQLSYARNLSARVLNNMGAGFLRKGDELRATYAFEQSLYLEPRRAKTLKLLGLAHMRYATKLMPDGEPAAIEQHLQKSIDAYEKSLDIYPNPDVFYSLGRVYEQSGQLDLAQKAYQSCLLRQPQHEHSLRQSAQIYQARGQHLQAITAWENLLVLHADSDTYFALGNSYYKSGNMMRAAHAYSEANRIEPKSMETLANLGNALKLLGRLDEAHLAYRSALEIAPEDPRLYYGLGEVEVLLGDRNAAIDLFGLAIEKGVDHGSAYTVLIDLLRAAGRDEEARSWQEQRAATPASTQPIAD